MKTVKYSIAAILLIGFAAGCSSTMTVGPSANKDGYLGASGSLSPPVGASVTVPWVKAEVKQVKSK